MKRLKSKIAVMLAVCLVVMNSVPALAATIPEGGAAETEVSAQTENIVLSENDEYEESSPSNAKYEDIIPADEEDTLEAVSDDELADIVLEDDIDPDEASPAEAEYEEEFFAEVKVGNVIITAKASAGVVPEGTVFWAEKVVDAEVKEAIDEVVEEKRDDEAQVIESLKFDIKLLYNEEAIEPDGPVSINFAIADAAANADVNVYHIKEDKDTEELVEAEVLEVETNEEVKEIEEITDEGKTPLVVETVTESFSYYVVEFTVGEYQYVLNGDESVQLSVILTELNIEGTVTEAEVSNSELFTVEKDTEGDDWTVTALQAFSTKEWMKVTIGGKLYEITVTDDPAPTDHCKIGSQGYHTLQSAIDAVNNNETIIMLDNVTYGTSMTINNGKTFTIDFNDGSTSHTFTWAVTSGPTINRNIFAIGGNSNVTVKNMKFLAGDSAIQGNRIFEVYPTGTLTLYQMESNDEYGKRNIPVLNNGGIVYIDGGNITTNSTNSGLISPNASNPVVQNLGGTTTFKGNGTYTMENNSTGAAWLGRVITQPAQSTDADRDSECGTVIIENGTFNTGQIVDVNGKGTITINDATYGTGNGPIIKAFHGGIKSNITINNITASATVFSQVIEELETKINFQNGNVKYTPTRFCINQTGSAAMTSVSIKNGKFGPNTGSDDIHDEINNLLASGATLTALTGDPDGYTYKVETPPPVCKIGTTEYTSLEAAITAATSGQTITLLSDITYTVGPNFVIDGKTVTIDFDGHSLTTDIGSSSSSSGRDIFTVTNTGNLTVKNGTTVCICTYGNLNPFKTIGANSELTLIDMTQATKLSGFLTMNGGTATINGGTFGTSGSSQQITLGLSNNATLNLVNNPQFYFQNNLFVLGKDATDPDTLAASVTIDSGTFNSYNNGSAIIYAWGKSNVTINGGTYITTGTNTTSTPIFIYTYGYKSNVTINNFTSNSGQVFRSNCPNISEFAPKINNGHYKYIKGKFALDNDGTSKPNVKLNGGYFGPDTADDDALAEITAMCASGCHVEELETTDTEYADGYRYKVAGPQPNPDPQPSKSGGNTYTLFTGIWGNPVTTGRWIQNADGTWSYSTRYKFTETWGCIADAGKPDSKAWYYFDKNGNMLTGWHKLYWNGKMKWYYFSKTKDANEGKCQLGGITPDGYRVGADGAWIED